MAFTETNPKERRAISPTSPKVMAERAKNDPPKWQILDKVGINENDSFNPELYRYKMPTIFEFCSKELIDN